MATSFAVVEQCFARGDEEGLLQALRRCQDRDPMQAFGRRWIADGRPVARRCLLRYVDDEVDRRHHRPLVKALYKEAWDRGDDELMAHFLVAFDRFHRYRAELRRGWSWRYRAEVSRWVLVNAREPAGSWSGRFSDDTARYLKRRTVRYLRGLDDARYLEVAVTALRLLSADAYDPPEALVGAFGVLHILFRHSDALKRTSRGFRLRGALADLSPAPERPAVWTPEALLRIVDAPNSVVRAFAIALLRPRPEAVGVDQLLAWLRCDLPDLRQFALDCLRDCGGLEKLPLRAWLALLDSDDPDVVAWAADGILTHVLPERLSTAQRVALCLGPAEQLAQAALSWLIEDEPAPDGVVACLDAPHASVRARVGAWMAGRAVAAGDPLVVRDLLDASHPEVRAEGLALVVAEPFADDKSLWAAMAESPFPDVADVLLPHLESRRHLVDPVALHAAALLTVGRGAAHKRRAILALRARLAAHPDEADALLPLLAIPLRSSREAERRAAMAALGRLAFEAPSLRPALRRRFPELVLSPEEAA